jgi:hypothetical protein
MCFGQVSSPFEKGGSRGIYLENLPLPLFFKEGSDNDKA